MRFPCVLFDLFRTVVLFTPDAPTGRVMEPGWRRGMEPLRKPLAQMLPGVGFEKFLDTLTAISGEIAEERAPEHYEVPIEARYGRALRRLGVREGRIPELAERFSSLQMKALAEHTRFPAEHLELLRSLGRGHSLALLSNFDHAPTVRGLLARYRLDALFDVVLVSVEFGRRKPHPAIFREAARRLGCDAAEALHVGDSIADDVRGARAAGVASVWLNPTGKSVPAGEPLPAYEIRRLAELSAIAG